jgi:hypothetical protein
MPGRGEGIAQDHPRMRIGEYFHQIEETIGLCPGVWMKTMLYDERSETKGFIRREVRP